MVEISFKWIIEYSEYLPTLYVKIIKGNRKFLYSISLSILYLGKRREIATVDNYHEKGSHIHKIRRIGKNKIARKWEEFEFKNISTTIGWFYKNYKKLIERYLKNVK